MKNKILSFIARYHYPQIIFGKEIKKILKQKNIETIVDAPCGNGEVAYHLSTLSKVKVLACDSSDSCISTAKRNFGNRKNICFIKDDIFHYIDSIQKIDAFCLVNSLFLFKNYDVLLTKIHSKLNPSAYLIVIIPNIKGKNYQKFIKNPAHQKLNHLELHKSQITNFFKQFGFDIVLLKEIVHAYNYQRPEAKIMSVLIHFYLFFIDKICSLFKLSQKNYFLIVLRKTQ